MAKMAMDRLPTPENPGGRAFFFIPETISVPLDGVLVRLALYLGAERPL